MRFVTRLLLTVGIVAAIASPTHANAAQKLTISPTSQDLVLNAGDTTKAIITVSAPDEALLVSYEHADYGLGKNYTPLIILDDAKKTTSFSTRGWFHVKEPKFKVPAKESVDVEINITVPKNTPGGTYMGAALFSVIPSKSNSTSQIQARAGAAAVIFISVRGGSAPKPHIDKFAAPTIVSGKHFTPTIIINNKGSMSFLVDGVLKVDGKKVKPGGEIAQQHILPNQPRSVKPNKDGKSSLVVPVKELSIGKHILSVHLRITPTNSTLIINKTFWLIPIWLRVLLGVVLIAALLLLSWTAAFVRRNKNLATRNEFNTPAENHDDDSTDHESSLIDDESEDSFSLGGEDSSDDESDDLSEDSYDLRSDEEE